MDSDTSLEVDPAHTVDSAEADLDHESTYGSGSESGSLYSVARYHVFENGRRYHGYREGTYFLPNDQEEQDRMDLHHHVFLLSLRGELGLAPVQNPQRVLDLGCGTGIWAIDYADTHPSAEVIGTDLSPIQPIWVPPNCTFVVDDIESPWLWAANSFDYIHMRSLPGFIKDWPTLLSRIYRALRPGGIVELQDKYDFFHSDDNTLPASSSLPRWVDLWAQAAALAGRPWLEIVEHFDTLLAGAGFEGVEKRVLKVPVGPWPKEPRAKELGMFMQRHEYDGAESICVGPFTKVLGWDMKRVKKLVAEVRRDLVDPRVHCSIKFMACYGRKPLDA
ncbi:S-adenosyl-L-methionine-dependent methyltransferase [Geopyxis carbonaria]|nr:S-adenosyl-L-methionine-dependent methyltransferase [Geopyxis carbonaria]